MSLFDQYGQLLNKTVIPMHARHIRGMCDGQYFSTHPRILQDVQLELVCDQCVNTGVSGAITTTLLEDKLEFRCAHAHGYIKTDRRSDFSAILHTLGWSLVCSTCGEEASGDNDTQAPTLDVACACTIRRLANPIAKAGTA